MTLFSSGTLIFYSTLHQEVRDGHIKKLNICESIENHMEVNSIFYIPITCDHAIKVVQSIETNFTHTHTHRVLLSVAHLTVYIKV